MKFNKFKKYLKPGLVVAFLLVVIGVSYYVYDKNKKENQAKADLLKKKALEDKATDTTEATEKANTLARTIRPSSLGFYVAR